MHTHAVKGAQTRTTADAPRGPSSSLMSAFVRLRAQTQRTATEPPPVVLRHVPERGVDPALRGDGVRARREQLRDARRLQAVLGESDRGAQASAAGAHHHGVVLVVDDRVRGGACGDGRRKRSVGARVAANPTARGAESTRIGRNGGDLNDRGTRGREAHREPWPRRRPRPRCAGRTRPGGSRWARPTWPPPRRASVAGCSSRATAMTRGDDVAS